MRADRETVSLVGSNHSAWEIDEIPLERSLLRQKRETSQKENQMMCHVEEGKGLTGPINVTYCILRIVNGFVLCDISM